MNKFPSVYFETLLVETQEVVKTECIAQLYWIGPFFQYQSSQQNNVPECIEHVQTASFVIEQPAE